MENEGREINTYHVWPTRDKRRHFTKRGEKCPCFPDVFLLHNGDIMISHNSFDGREWQDHTNHRLN